MNGPHESLPSLPAERATPIGERGGGRGSIMPTQRMTVGSPVTGLMSSDALGSAPMGGGV